MCRKMLFVAAILRAMGSNHVLTYTVRPVRQIAPRSYCVLIARQGRTQQDLGFSVHSTSFPSHQHKCSLCIEQNLLFLRQNKFCVKSLTVCLWLKQVVVVRTQTSTLNIKERIEKKIGRQPMYTHTPQKCIYTW